MAPSVLEAQPNREAGSGLMRAPASVAGPRSGHEAQRDHCAPGPGRGLPRRDAEPRVGPRCRRACAVAVVEALGRLVAVEAAPRLAGIAQLT